MGLLIDLLTPEEDEVEQPDADVPVRYPAFGVAARRCNSVAEDQPDNGQLPVALFGEHGAAAALMAAAEVPDHVRLVISRGGRPDLAGQSLEQVGAPTLLIVGGRDVEVLALNKAAATRLSGPVEIAVVPGATHLFEETGALERVIQLSLDALNRHLNRSPSAQQGSTEGVRRQ